MGGRVEERLSVYMEKEPSAAMFLFRHLCGSCARQELPDGTNMPWRTVCRRLRDRPRLELSVMVADWDLIINMSYALGEYYILHLVNVYADYRPSGGIVDPQRDVGSWLIDKRDR